MAFIFSPIARLATIEPTFPQPMTPSVLLVISTPMKRFFSHLPAWVEASACGICRASASISVIACSAVVIADELGELLLVGAELGLEIDLDAAILEDLHGGGRERIGDEDFGGHDG